MDNLSILTEAKREYMGQLCLIMCPPMIDVFNDIYEEANKLSNGRKVLIIFKKSPIGPTRCLNSILITSRIGVHGSAIFWPPFSLRVPRFFRRFVSRRI